MDLYRLGVKLFAKMADTFDVRECVPVFHSWIQRQAIPGHLLIDVHDYSHIFRGPGILLVAHEGNFSMDQGDGRLGLAYSRKTDEAGDFEARLLGNFKHALQACALLEREEKLTSRITFRTDEAVVVFNDRLVAANNGDVLQQVQPQLARALGRIWNAPLTIEAVSPNSPERLSFRMRAPHAQSVDALLARL